MKKFIKELEDRGIMESMVDSAIITEKMTGCPVSQDGIELILGFHMTEDEDLEDMFVEESNAIAMNSVFKYFQKLVTERQKVEALNDVDFDALFTKVKELTFPKKVESEKPLEERVEEMLLNELQTVVRESFAEMMKSIIDGCK